MFYNLIFLSGAEGLLFCFWFVWGNLLQVGWVYGTESLSVYKSSAVILDSTYNSKMN